MNFTKEQVAYLLSSANNQKANTARTVIPAQGRGGLLAGGMEREVINDIGLPIPGAMGRLPVFESRKGALHYSILSGMSHSVEADGTDQGAGTAPGEADGACDPFPQAGQLSGCTFCAPWGRFGRASGVINLTMLDEDDYCDTDLVLVGGPQQASAAAMIAPDLDSANPLTNTIDKAMLELKFAFHSDFPGVIWTGNPANNSAGGGYREAWGFENLINTGYTDAESGLACPSADAIVDDYANVTIDSDPCAFYDRLVDNFRKIWYTASRDGLGEVRGFLSGPLWMFDCLVDAVKCCGMCRPCDTPLQNPQLTTNRDLAEVERMYLDMRRRMYIPIEGVEVPFVVDDHAPTTINGGNNCGTLWFIPETILGGRFQVTYRQYKPFRGAEMQAAMRTFGTGNIHKVLANGAWFVWTCWEGPCVQIQAVTQQRLVMRKPAVSFRMDNVCCEPGVEYPDLTVGGGSPMSTAAPCPDPTQ